MSLITCFYVMQAAKMFYIVELLQLTVVHYINNSFQHLWLVAIFIYDHNFTISHDEVTMNLRRSYDNFMIVNSS